jgi:hypothetical protein
MTARMFAPWPNTKSFGGRRYTISPYIYTSRSMALRAAKAERSRGRAARVVEGRSSRGRQVWGIYVRGGA